MVSLEQIEAQLDAELPLQQQIDGDVLRLLFDQEVSSLTLSESDREQLWLFYIADESEAEKIARVEALPDSLQEAALSLLGYEIDSVAVGRDLLIGA